MPRRPILLALLVAGLTTLGVLVIARSGMDGGGRAAIDAPAPPIVGTTLDGTAFDLSSLRGKPVVINFWASWCVPCRDEFPLLDDKLRQHADDGLAIIGVLFEDQPAAASAFVERFGAGWPTVPDADGGLATAYRVVAPPQTYFVDGAGVIRSIQIGELTDADFERQYSRIAP